MTVLHKAAAAAAGLLVLTSCSSDSTVETGETWAPPTQAQVDAWRPHRVNPYIRKMPPPKMDRNGCASSVRKENGGLVIPSFHPDETYCIRVAPLTNTTLALPPGSRLESATSAMMQYISISSAKTNERDVILLTSKCVPARKDENGNVKPSDLHEFVDQSSVPYCPRYAADLTVVMTTGIAQFRLILNASSHDTRITMQDQPPEVLPVTIPVRPAYAQDLHIESLNGQEIPWWPDEAWSDGDRTVIIWRRPMPTLPAFMLGPDGEQRATPLVVNRRAGIAMIYPQRVTRFQLRLDDRILVFSETKPKPFIQPAES